jgi:hypothetical protein
MNIPFFFLLLVVDLDENALLSVSVEVKPIHAKSVLL